MKKLTHVFVVLAEMEYGACDIVAVYPDEGAALKRKEKIEKLAERYDAKFEEWRGRTDDAPFPESPEWQGRTISIQKHRILPAARKPTCYKCSHLKPTGTFDDPPGKEFGHPFKVVQTRGGTTVVHGYFKTLDMARAGSCGFKGATILVRREAASK